jgi:HIRAN domain
MEDASRAHTPILHCVDAFLIEGDSLVPVVGTSHYQAALTEISGRRGDEEIRVERIAVLVPEPDNPYDPKAIAVHIERQLVGYLSRDENPRWQDIVETLATHDHRAAAEAMIAGRGPGGGTSNLGVFLRLPTPTEARAQVGIRFRSGSDKFQPPRR